jgi:hypothetical protein
MLTTTTKNTSSHYEARFLGVVNGPPRFWAQLLKTCSSTLGRGLIQVVLKSGISCDTNQVCGKDPVVGHPLLGTWDPTGPHCRSLIVVMCLPLQRCRQLPHSSAIIIKTPTRI